MEKREEERKKEGEKEQNETVSAKRRCVGFISAEAFHIFSQEENFESCGGVSWSDLLDDLPDCELETRTVVSAMLVVTDVLVSPSSVATECCEDVSLGCDWEIVEPQSFSFSTKRASVCAENQGDGSRRVASKSASDIQKRDDAAYATAKFVFFDG